MKTIYFKNIIFVQLFIFLYSKNLENIEFNNGNKVNKGNNNNLNNIFLDYKIEEIDALNFNDKIISTEDIWLINIYAPWSEKSNSFLNEWYRLSNSLNNIIRFGIINGPENMTLVDKFEIQGYPAIYFIGKNKNDSFNNFYYENHKEFDLIDFKKWFFQVLENELSKSLNQNFENNYDDL